jgi:ATP-dependent Clp protease ATP-binding subunit ClpL
LSKDDLGKIVDLLLQDVSDTLAKKQLTLTVSDEAKTG